MLALGDGVREGVLSLLVRLPTRIGNKTLFLCGNNLALTFRIVDIESSSPACASKPPNKAPPKQCTPPNNVPPLGGGDALGDPLLPLFYLWRPFTPFNVPPF